MCQGQYHELQLFQSIINRKHTEDSDLITVNLKATSLKILKKKKKTKLLHLSFPDSNMHEK